MPSKPWTLTAIPLVLFVYFFVGVGTKRSGEIFPIYHWGLFAAVETPTTLGEVYLEEVDGERYNPPVRLQDTESYRRLMMSDYDIYNTPNVIRRLAAALASGRYERAAELEAAFEANFLEQDRVRYSVVNVTFDPVERYRTGKVVSRETVGRLTKGIEEGEREANR